MREQDLLRHIYATTGDAVPGVKVGPGDDMAMIGFGDRDLLAAVDQVVAEVHFRSATTPPALVGRKAVARCLSDVAAMAGAPVAALVTAVLPPGYGSSAARELFDGMHAAAEAYRCPLVGGDIAFHADPSGPLVCTVTVLATPGDAGPILRQGARIGDTVYVTGALGGALGSVAPVPARHLTFTPRLEEAHELHRGLGSRLHAMIDISDGLGRDAANIAVASGVRIEIDVARIPCHDDVGWRQAASEGEDYELLFTAVGEVPSRLGGAVPVTAVGRVVADDDAAPAGEAGSSTVVFRDESGKPIPGDALGWQHES